MDFATMTHEQALDELVDLDVAKWGEGEREASRRKHARASRGLLINSIVYHSINQYGDMFTATQKKIAKAQQTADDVDELRKGG